MSTDTTTKSSLETDDPVLCGQDSKDEDYDTDTDSDEDFIGSPCSCCGLSFRSLSAGSSQCQACTNNTKLTVWEPLYAHVGRDLYWNLRVVVPHEAILKWPLESRERSMNLAEAIVCTLDKPVLCNHVLSSS